MKINEFLLIPSRARKKIPTSTSLLFPPHFVVRPENFCTNSELVMKLIKHKNDKTARGLFESCKQFKKFKF